MKQNKLSDCKDLSTIIILYCSLAVKANICEKSNDPIINVETHPKNIREPIKDKHPNPDTAFLSGLFGEDEKKPMIAKNDPNSRIHFCNTIATTMLAITIKKGRSNHILCIRISPLVPNMLNRAVIISRNSYLIIFIRFS